MRAGWQIKTLGEICDIARGGSPRPIQKFLTREPDGVNWIKIGDATVSSKYIYKTQEKIKPEGVKRSRLVKPGDFLLSNSMSFGRPYIMRTTGCIHDGWLVLSDKAGLFDQDYLYYFLGSAAAYKQFDNLAAGSTVRNLNTELVKHVTVPLPPIPEQQRIVAILDEAFTGLATATANAEKNLKNARELFEGYLQSIFDQTKSLGFTASHAKGPANWHGSLKFDGADSTRTGGRAATTRHIEGRRSLCVGMPKSKARSGWTWFALDGLARMESGHTPSRRHPEYWGGGVPWIGIRDAKAAHGREIFETLESTNTLGLENSSARLLPAQTVCLSRTASVGYVTVMGRPMATSQDFVNWVCSDKLYPRFLMYLFLAQGDEIFKFSSGAVHQTIYFPEAKAFHICQPPVNEQHQIVEVLDALREQAEKLEALYERRITDLAEMTQAILQKAFSGELTSPPSQAIQEAAE